MIGFKPEEAGKVNLPQEYLQRIVDSIVLAVPETECIYLFGSYARGEEHEDSDVDIYVVTNKVNDGQTDFPAMLEIRKALSWMRKPKDVLCLSQMGFDKQRSKHWNLEHVVAKEGVRIYGD